MNRRSFFRNSMAAASVAGAAAQRTPPAESEQVLFAFDDHALPFQKALRLELVNFRRTLGQPSNIVLRPSAPGSPDARGVLYYGSVHLVGDEFWMWYLGHGEEQQRHLRVCLAKSKDGRTWSKPSLGLIDYQGSKSNNIVDLMGAKEYVNGCVVFHEPEDPDASRRFKLIFESKKYTNRLAVAFSADGVRWRESAKNPVGPWIEPGGGTKFNGAYHVAGHGGKHFTAGNPNGFRKLITHISYDFENWTEATCMGFRRDPLPPQPTPAYGWNAGEQVHVGAGLWNRGNVVIGVYGQWHGHVSNDRRLVGMDLGLVVSNDALHYREPIPDFRLIEASEVGYEVMSPLEQMPALMQGQGFANHNDETLFWYSPWPQLTNDGIRLASWKRDRLGYLQPYLGPGETPHVISAPVSRPGKGPVTVSLNVEGLSDHAKVQVSILDERLRVLAGHSAEACNGPAASGLRQAVTWTGRKEVAHSGPIRIRVDFGGIRPEDVKLYAVYVG